MNELLKKFANAILGYDSDKIISDKNMDIERYKKIYSDLSREYEQVCSALETLRHQYYDNFEELSDLKEMINDHVDILFLKDWYESRRDKRVWKYNGGRLGEVDVSKYLVPKNNSVFTQLAMELIQKYKLHKDMPVTNIIDKIYYYWNLKNSWTYAFDNDLHGKNDWWEDSSEALDKRLGDCETKAMVMYNSIISVLDLLKLKNHSWRLLFTCSNVLGEGGHGYLLWLHDDGEYYVIESTYDNINSKNKTWLQTPIRYNNLYGTPWGFATIVRSWKGSNSALKKYTK